MNNVGNMLRTILIAAVSLVAFNTAALAEEANPSEYLVVDRGADLAELWCNACHVVSGAPEATGKDAAPPFPSLAPLVKSNADRYRLFLKNPHSQMQEISLSRDEIEALLAFIRSQDPEG